MNFKKTSHIAAAPERVFAFHELPDAFERLVPPWENVKVIRKADISEIGSQAILEQKLFGIFPSRWVAEHTAYEPPRMFEDIQVSGPFKMWKHKHIVVPDGDGALLIDDIDYEPPFSFLGAALEPMLVRPKLEKMFEYRHRVTREWCDKGNGGSDK